MTISFPNDTPQWLKDKSYELAAQIVGKTIIPEEINENPHGWDYNEKNKPATILPEGWAHREPQYLDVCFGVKIEGADGTEYVRGFSIELNENSEYLSHYFATKKELNKVEF